MLRVNVGMSRKLSRDFNSTGFSINIEGEVGVALDDPERVIEKVRELYDLADEALRDQIERHESDSAIASHDEQPPRRFQTNPPGSDESGRYSRSSNSNARRESGNGGNAVPATNKQIQFLLNLGKRMGLNKVQLEQRLTEILGREADVYQLTKRDAGAALDVLTSEANADSSRN
jgi:hypothetical protein